MIYIQILQCGGNLFDAVGIAVKAALNSTEIPKITTATLDGGEPDIELSDDPYDCIQLDTSNYPIIVTLCKVCFLLIFMNNLKKYSILFKNYLYFKLFKFYYRLVIIILQIQLQKKKYVVQVV